LCAGGIRDKPCYPLVTSGRFTRSRFTRLVHIRPSDLTTKPILQYRPACGYVNRHY